MNTKNILATFIVTLFWSSLTLADGNQNIQIYHKKAEFADARQDLIDAIIDRGYVVDYNGRVGDMLKRTRAEVGGKPLYRNAEYMSFCSAVLSRQMMADNRENISYCPFVITVYEAESSPGTIYLSYRRPTAGNDANPSLAAIEKMYQEIASAALE